LIQAPILPEKLSALVFYPADFSLYRFTDNIAGYSKYQALLFFLTYNFLDVASQAFFRGIYSLRDDVRKGDFDYIAVRPVNPLFYLLTKITDILDFIFLGIIIIYHLCRLLFKIPVTISAISFTFLCWRWVF
jgi:ABC-type uncharacterized transport system permease subunit